MVLVYKKKHKFDLSLMTNEQQTGFFNMIEHVRSMAQEWGIMSFLGDARRPYNLDRNSTVSDSWKYEYAQFELVNIYKSFDWENNIMIYYGH